MLQTPPAINIILPVFSDVEHRKPPATFFGVEIETTQVSFEVELGQRASSVASRQHLKVAPHGRQHRRQLQLYANIQTTL